MKPDRYDKLAEDWLDMNVDYTTGLSDLQEDTEHLAKLLRRVAKEAEKHGRMDTWEKVRMARQLEKIVRGKV